MRSLLIRSLFIFALTASLTGCMARAASSQPIPPPTDDAALAKSGGKQTAVFAGGCFWGTQSVFERVKGVLKTTAGYAGGSAASATYDQVTTETTGHAESVKVVYDPSKITYGQLLRIFFSVAHDPTQLNRQGPDVGTSYRSAIFYANDEQKRLATEYIHQLDAAHVFPRPIVTQIAPLKGFYAAEDYHQDYALHHPENPYILVCDRPKIEALKQQFPNLFVDYKGSE
jgi:peptide-methionine (S)-S-oxide reductase